MTSPAPTLLETITIYLAKTFGDAEVGFTGLTTGQQAALYGTSIPLAAMAFARATHAPNLSILLAGWCINPDVSQLRRLPDLEFAQELTDLPAEAHVTGYPNAIGYKRRDVDFGFSSGAQIDQYGSVNSVAIGDYANPKVRLVGPILQPEHFTKFKREVVMMPRHDARTFVPEVDYRSGVGHLPNRDELGLHPGSGPALVITPLGIFDFTGPDKSMHVRTVHAGVSRDQLAASTGFPLDGLETASQTPLPTDEELTILRRKIDPRRILLPVEDGLS